MHVKGLELAAFMSHAATAVQLPAAGVVLVTGANGAGKSSFVEAVATACWGKTLRGTDPWQTGCPGQVRCTTDLGTATRAVTKGGSKSATWTPAGEAEGSIQHDTSAKAKAAAEAVLGDFDTWRRTHVFSSQDASHFSTATDATRKALLEELLGLGFFDAAAERATAALRLANTTRDAAARTEAAARGALTTVEAQLQTLQATPPEPRPATPLAGATEPDSSAAKALVDQATKAAQDATVAEREAAKQLNDPTLVQARADAVAELRAAERHLQAVDAGTCSACGQVITADHKVDAAGRVHVAVSAVEAAEELLRRHKVEQQAQYDAACQASAAARAALDEARANLREQLAGWQMKLDEDRAIQAWTRREYARKQQLKDLQERRVQAYDALEAAEAAHMAAQQEADTLAVVQQVLGMRGVRAQVLGEALGGIEAVANVYLARLAQRDLQLRLRSYTETASATTQEKISMELVGAGGGHGYKAASGGERRRIDAALLLALAEVASHASGRPPGTIFLDEVFDAIDDEGVDALAAALVELSADRAVVLITHSELLAERVPAAMRLRVDQGAVHLA